MSMECVVSALHRRSFLDTTAIKAPNQIVASSDTSVAILIQDPRSLRYRSPAIESILAWRQRIANKYRDQLGEELTWNERSRFERSEEVAASLAADPALPWATDLLFQVGQVGPGHALTRRALERLALDVAPRLGWRAGTQ